MALIVSNPMATPFGTTVSDSYWRWVSMQIQVPQQTATVILSGYVDEQAFIDGKQWIGQRALNISGEDFMAVAATLEGITEQQPLSQLIYQWAKDHDEFFAAAKDA